MKLPKELTTVTTFSKYLALSLFIILPFLGFYLGRQFQKTIDDSFRPPVVVTRQMPALAPTNLTGTNSAALDMSYWKEFKDPSGSYEIHFPQNWLISFEQSPRYKDKTDVKLEGPEGHVDIMWADSYGGACENPGYEKVQIQSGEETICHAYHIQGQGKDNNAEFWQLQKPFNPAKPLGIYLNVFAYKNSQLPLQVLKSTSP